MLSRSAVNTGCGSASSAVGPFYCSGDGRIYLDLSFYRDMERQLGAVGDDRLQRRARGSVDPDSFTHGTSEQRARWFNAGRESGEPGACDTFSPDDV